MLAPSDIIDAGTDSDGAVYVLVEQSSELRLFVGSSTGLIELYVLGSGQGSSHGPGQFWTAQSMMADGSLVTVEVQSASTGLVMGVVKGPIPGKGFDVGTVGDVLTPLASADAASIPATTTQTFHVEYVGNSRSETVVVVAPDHAGSYDGFRLFLGPLGDLAEQPVSAVNRGLSIPSNTYLDFTDTDATPEQASLTYGIGSGTLTVAGMTTTLADSGATTAPTSAVFECL